VTRFRVPDTAEPRRHVVVVSVADGDGGRFDRRVRMHVLVVTPRH
jgi:hypothetical protein